MHYTKNGYNCIIIDKYHTLDEIDNYVNYIYKQCNIKKYKCSQINDCEFTVTIVIIHAEKKYQLQNLILELILLEFSMNQIKELILDSFLMKEVILNDKSVAYCIIEQN